MTKGKGLIRSLNRRGSASGKLRPAETRTGRLAEPVICERCGAVFGNRRWRRGGGRLTHALLERATWKTCPACVQSDRQEYLGRILVRGSFATANEAAIRRRIRNVAARAEHSQPERRVVSVDRAGDSIEVLTTSQKLAHRIVHELKKAFLGRARYTWLDDGSLHATWERKA